MTEYIYVWSDGSWCEEDDVLEYLDTYGGEYSIVCKDSDYALELMQRSSDVCT